MTAIEPRRGVFITGTDTGVGKTLVACALARGLRNAGVDLGVMKPVETGVPESGPADAHALREAAASNDPIDLICPLQFATPASPEAAAQAEGRKAPIEPILSSFHDLSRRHDAMLVEGAGGLLVPFDAEQTMADLALALGLPLIVVARSALGTINHTRLTLESCESRGLEVLGVIISHSTGILTDADERNLETLRVWLDSRLIGEIGPLPRDASDDEGDVEPGTDAPGDSARIDEALAGAVAQTLARIRKGAKAIDS